MSQISKLLAAFLIFAFLVQTGFALQSLKIGDPFHYSVNVPEADSVVVIEPADARIRILPYDQLSKRDGKFEFSAAAYDTGVIQVPPFTLLLLKNGQVIDSVVTEDREIIVEAILPDTALTPRPIKPFESHPLRFADVVREFWPWALFGILALGVLYVWGKYFRNKKAITAVPSVLELPPSEIAIRELIAFRDKKYPERGMLKEHYSEFSEILRRYMERSWSFPALEMTTFELAHELKREDLPSCLYEELLPALREADLVKFAKEVPTLSSANLIVDLGFRIIEMTKPHAESVVNDEVK